MKTEFLVPAQYTGEGYGVSARLRGLQEDVDYISLVLSIDSSVVDVQRDATKSSIATFQGLEENKVYEVVATISTDEETYSFSAKFPSRKEFVRSGNPQRNGGVVIPTIDGGVVIGDNNG